MTFVGMDIETTGLRVDHGHRLIQIGLAFDQGRTLGYYVHPQGVLAIDPEAMAINRIPMTTIMRAPSNDEIDLLLDDYLKLRYEPGELIAVGWNVGPFDMAFLRHDLPKTSAYFDYRHVLDLTSLTLMHEVKTGKPYRTLKDEFHAEIARRLGESHRHDAIYDARAALEAVKLFKELT